ncbi:MAG TPA: hypothetical protein VGC41_12520, partial [Kofleriaceae bacterium]
LLMHRLALASSVVVALAQPSFADPCANLPNPIYLQVGATQHNLMQSLARKLRENTAHPITLVWSEAGSCNNIDLMYLHSPANGITVAMNYVPTQAENPGYTNTSTPLTCTPPAAPFFPDIANSALFNSACATGQQTPPDNLEVTEGPKQGYVLGVVRGVSSATAITAEEAYFLFGFGPTILGAMNAALSPWIDQNEVFILGTTKSTLLAWAAQLGIPVGQMKGNNTATTDAGKMAQVLLDPAKDPNPAAGIAIMGSEVYDGARDTVQVLAFKAFHQYAAYYPDSTATSRDKKNLRDGHYTVWSPTVWMEFVDAATKVPVKADARYVIDLILGNQVTPAPNFAANEVIARVGLVPDCAMRVKRAFEGGPLSLYKPATSCTCAYEATVATSSCQVCSASVACTSGVCRDGFCEEY